MNSFISARLQRKLRKLTENPLLGSRVSGPTFKIANLGSRILAMRWIPGIGSRVPAKVLGLGSYFLDIPIENRSRLFIYLSLIDSFSKLLCQNIPCKAENWHSLSHEQYFSKHHFLDICRDAFKISVSYFSSKSFL